MILAAGHAPQADLIVICSDNARHGGAVIVSGVLIVAGEHHDLGIAAQILVVEIETTVNDAHADILEPLLIVPGGVGADGLGPPVGAGRLTFVPAVRLGTRRLPGILICGGRLGEHGHLIAGVHYAVRLFQRLRNFFKLAVILCIYVELKEIDPAA